MRLLLIVLPIMTGLLLPATGFCAQSQEEIARLRNAAEQGVASAQYNVGVMYGKGEGVQQDYAEALKWIRLAAAQGYAGAQCSIGSMYQEGIGVQQDYAEALRWYRLAAAQGLAAAQSNIGVMYENGEWGGKQDYAEALRWYRLAAAQGLAEAQYNIGVMYLKGLGVRQNSRTAKEWFGKACDNGYQQGCEVYRILIELGH